MPKLFMLLDSHVVKLSLFSKVLLVFDEFCLIMYFLAMFEKNHKIIDDLNIVSTDLGRT